MIKLNRVITLVLFGLLLLGSLIISGCTADRAPLGTMTVAEFEEQASRGEAESEAEERVLASLVPLVNLTPQIQRLQTGAEVTLFAEAIDPSGGALEYAWSTNVGAFVNRNDTHVLWQAPDYSTRALLTCKVTDSRGKVGSATVEIDVIGKTTYQVKLYAEPSSLAVSQSGHLSSDYVPLSGARVSIEGENVSELTDSAGVANLDLEQDIMGKSVLIRVTYKNWDLAFETLLPIKDGDNRSDELIFMPGFEGASIALARGDSFWLTYGMVEVRPVENRSDTIKSIGEVKMSVGASTVSTSGGLGRVAVPASRFGNETDLRLSKDGYQPMENVIVPLAAAQTTLIQAKLLQNGQTSGIMPYISYIKPYIGQTSLFSSSPIEIGFGQPMNQDLIFDDFEMLLVNKASGEIMGLSNNDIQRKFNIEWKNAYTLLLHPKTSFVANTLYAINIKRWNAYAADGRALRDYTGLYREFISGL